MHEVDDRLAGDPVWELFPSASPGPARGALLVSRVRYWLAVAGTVAVIWSLYPPAAVVAACLAVAIRDFRAGRRLARSIPDKAGGTSCALFTYAWGLWKLGLAAFVLMFVSVAGYTAAGGRRDMPPGFAAAMLLWAGGFTTSAALSAAGLVKAYRSGMRVWIGEGINQARMLLMGMLVVAFTFLVLGPMCLWLVGRFPRASHDRGDDLTTLLVFFGCMFGGPVIILVALDRVCRRVVADRPGKFGPKVPTVGKWNS